MESLPLTHLICSTNTSKVGSQTLSYDNNFNLSDDNTHSYSFNAQNELVGVDGVTVQLVYDGLGRVLKRTINGSATIFVYDGWKVIEELDGSGNRVAWNIYGAGADEILYRNQRGTAFVYHTDKEGNVMFLLDAAGNGIERYTYDAFGAAKIMDWSGNLRGGSAYGNRYMFNGKDYVAEMGLYDYRHRWYQPQLGRFLQVDPKGFDAGDENLFRYCLDDPVDRVDPDGLESPGSAAERAAAQERRYEITEEPIREEVTGSHIPQVVGTETTIKVSGGANNSVTLSKRLQAALAAPGTTHLIRNLNGEIVGAAGSQKIDANLLRATILRETAGHWPADKVIEAAGSYVRHGDHGTYGIAQLGPEARAYSGMSVGDAMNDRKAVRGAAAWLARDRNILIQGGISSPSAGQIATRYNAGNHVNFGSVNAYGHQVEHIITMIENGYFGRF